MDLKRLKSPSSPDRDKTGGFHFQWLHDSEPVFPDDAKYTIQK